MYQMFDYAAVAVALIGCFIGLRSDQSTGKIPNKLTGSMLLASAALAALRISAGDMAFPALYAQNFALGFLIGIIFWNIRAWSGGDAKMFWALCSLLPAYPEALIEISSLPLPWYAQQFFGLTILFNLLILLLIRFFLAAVYLSLKQGQTKELLKTLSSPIMYLLASTLLGIGIARITGIPGLAYLSIAFVFALSIAERASYPKFLALWAAFAAAGALMAGIYDIPSLLSLAAHARPLYIFAFLMSAYAVGSQIPHTRKNAIKDLRTGMSLSEEIYLEKDALIRKETSTSLWNTITTRLLNRKKHDYIVRPRPIGLTAEDLGNLKKYADKLGGYVEVNKSFILMPFILLALITSFFGDLLWMMLS
jgi:hypothetical protein